MGHTVWIEQCGDYAHSDGWRQRWQSYGSRLELQEDANGWCLVCTGTEEESGAGTEELFHDPRYYNAWNAVHGACGLRLRIYSEHEAAHAVLHIRYSEDRWQTSENRWRHAMPLRAGLNDIVLPFDDGQWTAEGRESYIRRIFWRHWPFGGPDGATPGSCMPSGLKQSPAPTAACRPF